MILTQAQPISWLEKEVHFKVHLPIIVNEAIQVSFTAYFKEEMLVFLSAKLTKIVTAHSVFYSLSNILSL